MFEKNYAFNTRFDKKKWVIPPVGEKKISGIFEKAIYHNESNGFTIAVLRNEKKIKGYIPSPQPGLLYVFDGKWEKHNKFGYSFSFENYTVCYPKDTDAICSYLIENCRWIGTGTARSLIDKYGHETLKTCKENPKEISSIRGITLDRANEISKMLKENEERENIELEIKRLLLGIRISKKAITEIIKKYKDNSVNIIKNNPYNLINNIKGIGFLTADQIAVKNGFNMEGEPRISAGIIHTLTEETFNGHTCFPHDFLISHTKDILSIPGNKIDLVVVDMIASKRLIKIDNFIYLSYLYNKEKYIAEKIKTTFFDKNEKSSILMSKDIIDAIIESVQNKRETGKLYSDQINALKIALSNKIFILTGSPGTGKTFIIKAIIESFPSNSKIYLASPTGKAAKRIIEQTGHDASTIHKLLKPKIDDNGFFKFTRNSSNPIPADIIILDETSMIDIPLFYSFLNAVHDKTRLILVGDYHQLPAVGAGNVLKDLIHSGKIPHVELNIIKRQNNTAGLIVENCSKIKIGENIRFSDKEAKDFFFIEKMSEKQIQDTIIELITTRLPKHYSADPLSEIQIITPLREKTELSCKTLNKLCQNRLNKNKKFEKTEFRIGDKVIQTKNNYDLDIINGDIGYVKIIDFEEKSIYVNFENPNRRVRINLYENNLELAYVLTCHKFQGSETKIVIIPIHKSFGTFIMQRNWLYTAISRAKEVCILVGQKREIPKIISRNKQQKRYTNLIKFLEEKKEEKKQSTHLSEEEQTKEDLLF